MKFAEFRLELLQNNLNAEHLPLLIFGQIVATYAFFSGKIEKFGKLNGARDWTNSMSVYASMHLSIRNILRRIPIQYIPQCILVLETYYAEYLFNICLNASQY